MTFPTDVEIRKYSDEELTTILDKAGETTKHARKLGRAMGIVLAHRLKHMREFLAYEELAIWRRMNGFIELRKAKKVVFMVIVRFRPLRSNTLLVCGLR